MALMAREISLIANRLRLPWLVGSAHCQTANVLDGYLAASRCSNISLVSLSAREQRVTSLPADWIHSCQSLWLCRLR